MRQHPLAMVQSRGFLIATLCLPGLFMGGVSSQIFDDNSNQDLAEGTITTELISSSSTIANENNENVENTMTFDENNAFLGIPGTTQTKNGYDTALGTDPICWVGEAPEQENLTLTALDQLVRQVFPNPLVENFTLVETNILEECPGNNSVWIEKPMEALQGERLRTLRYYNYSVSVEIDLDSLNGDYIFSDDGNSTIALQVVVCSLGKSGFCSPFVHEQANSKDAIDRHKSGQPLVSTAKKVTGDLHGGTHIHSPWVFVDMGDARRLSLSNVQIPMIVNHPGNYFVIGTVQLYTGINGSHAYRYDISNALDAGEGRYLLYQSPAEIKEVTDGVQYFSYVAIGIASIVIIFLMAQTIWHRTNQVLQLSQGDILIVFLFSALVATVCAFLLDPKNDTYCTIRFPLIILPIHLMYSITVGRLWRIHAVISPLLLEHLSKGEPGIVQRFVQAITYVSFEVNNLFVRKKENKRRSTVGAKQQISKKQLALVVFIFFLPQLLFQIVAVIVQPQERVVEFNGDESIGRATCGTGSDVAGNLQLYSFVLLVLLVIVLLIMAHSSRKLPSLFNETHVIYDSTFLSMILLCLGVAVIALTSTPTSSPDVEYLVMLVLILSITLNSTVRILLPKLKMVWKGETVIVSKLVTDHHRKAREKQSMRDSSVMHGVTGFNPNDSTFQNSGGDYDPSQERRFLPTYHSNSYDVAYGNRTSAFSSDAAPSSMNDSSVNNFLDASATISNTGTRRESNNSNNNKEVFNASGQSFFDEENAASKELKLLDKAETKSPETIGKEQNVDVVSKKPTKKSTDLTGGSGLLPVDASNKRLSVTAEDDDQLKADIDGDRATDGQTTEGSEHQGELDTEASHPVGTDEAGRKVSFFEQGASGFLRNAMSKGLSSWRLDHKSETNLGSEKHAHDNNQGKHTSKTSPKKKPPRTTSRTKNLSRKIVVSEDETPARRLVMKMLDLQDQLEAVNNKIMSGLAVTQEDWGVITKLTSRLDQTFNNEVEFEWDLENQYRESLDTVMPLDMGGSNHSLGLGGSSRGIGGSSRGVTKGGSSKGLGSPPPKRSSSARVSNARKALKETRMKGMKHGGSGPFVVEDNEPSGESEANDKKTAAAAPVERRGSDKDLSYGEEDTASFADTSAPLSVGDSSLLPAPQEATSSSQPSNSHRQDSTGNSLAASEAASRFSDEQGQEDQQDDLIYFV